MQGFKKNLTDGAADVTGGGGMAVRSGAVRNGRDGRFLSSVSTDSLTPQQRTLVNEWLRNGGNAKAAGQAAGYSPTSVYATLKLPHVREAVQQGIDTGLRTEGAALAWGCIRSMLTDGSVPAAVRLQAARWTLEHAGLGLAAQQARLGLPSADAPLVSMNEAALVAFVEAGRAALAGLQTAADGKALPEAVDGGDVDV